MKKIIYLIIFVVLVSFTNAQTEIFVDGFNRSDSDTVGNGWVETSGIGTNAEILRNTLLITDNSGANAQVLDNIWNATSDDHIRIEYDVVLDNITGAGYIPLFDITNGAQNIFCLSFGSYIDTVRTWYHYDTDFRSIATVNLSNKEHHLILYNLTSNNYTFFINDIEVIQGIQRTECSSGQTVRIGFDGKNAEQYDLSFDELLVYNGTVGVAPPVPPVVANTTNVSFFASDLNISDFTFNTDVFFDAIEIQFNTSSTINLTLLSAFNTLKLSVPPQTNEIFGRVLIDNIIIADESLRTVSDIDEEGVTGFNPLIFQVDSGQHNLTIQFRRENSGIIEINDIDLILVHLHSTDNEKVRVQRTIQEITHSGSGLESLLNWTISNGDNNEVFIIAKQRLNASGSAVLDYHFKHLDDDDVSPFVSRFMSNGIDIGTVLNLWLQDDITSNGTYSILGQTSQNNITFNATILDFDLQDALNNTIHTFQLTNTSSNISSPLVLSSGKHLLLSENFVVFSGNSTLLMATISFKSTTAIHTPVFIINSTNSTIDCFSKKERYLQNNQDIGNAFLFTICNTTENLGYDFQLWVNIDNGETLNITDESFSGFEVSELDTISLPPDPSLFIDQQGLINNTINVNNDTLEVRYNLTIGLDNSINLFSCFFFANDTIELTETNVNTTSNFLFNFTIPDIENNLTFEIRCNNTEIFNTTGIFNYRIDKINPTITLVLPLNLNNSNQIQNSDLSVTFSLFDTNLDVYSINWTNQDGSVIQSIFAENLTGGTFVNVSNLVLATLGNNFTINVLVADSHNPITKEVKPLNWFYSDNLIIAEDFSFIGNFKGYDGRGNLATYFYLSDNKYKMKITFENITDKHLINFTAKGKLRYIQDSKYKGHFVYTPKFRYVDFEGDNIKEVNLLSRKNKIYQLEIVLYNESDEIELESIGDLNVVQVEYFYNVVSQDTILLTSIDSRLAEIVEVLKVLGYIFLIIIFLVLGVLVNYYFWWFSAVLFWLLTIIDVLDGTFTQDFSINIVYILFGFALFFGAIFLELGKVAQVEAESNTNMYDNFYN